MRPSCDITKAAIAESMASTDKRVPQASIMESGQLPPINGEGLSWNGRNPDEVHLGHYLRKVPQAIPHFIPASRIRICSASRPKCRVASLTADREKAAACAAALALTRITSLLAATNR